MGALEDGCDLRLDALFDLGLTALPDGLSPLFDGPPAAPPKA
ncbi:hypothetical protein [Streptomyces sp. LN699]